MKYIYIILLSVLFYSCKEETFKSLNADDKTIAEQVINVRVENLEGKVKIDYDFPLNSNVLYVEGEYIKENGEAVTVKSSYYNNTLTISGFGKPIEYEVNLYSVGKNLKRSAPVVVKVNPSAPPHESMYNSLKIGADFGGLRIEYADNDGSPLSIVVEKLNANDEWQNVDIFYTQQLSGVMFVRGLPPDLAKFRVYTRDKWGNKSSANEVELTPYYEEELDYRKFKHYPLPNDGRVFQGNLVSFLWNNNVSSNPSTAGGWTRTENGSGVPDQTTIDMGQKAKISRIILHQRGYISNKPLLYANGDLKYFEIWGSNSPASSGTYDSWDKIYEGEITKPSGLPNGTNTQEDIDLATGGREFPMPLESGYYRYLRIRVMETWGLTDYFWLAEVDVFGQIED